MAFTGIIRRCLKYPLMWVMLLWALTLPGHELAVYSFLVKGSVSEVAPSLKSVAGDQDDFSVKQQGVQVFLDAKTVSAIVLSPQHALQYAKQLFSFLPPGNEQLFFYTFQPAHAKLLAQLFSGCIQSNAP